MTQNLPVVYSMSDMEKMATSIVKSGLFGVKSIEQAVTLMLVAQAEGLHPATAARDYHVIQGRPALKADAMLARFQQAGGVVEWEEYTNDKVSAKFHHAQSPKPVLIEWTLDMARKIGLANKDNWKNYPRAMLRARVISEGIRTCYPAIATGIYTPEEVQDFAPERDITPIAPSAGAMSALPIKTQEVVMDTASQVKALLANDQAADAYALWQDSKFDNDQKVAFWSQLDSKQKGVLGRMAEAEEAQNKGVISPAKHKRLEALIKEFKLDRDGVKAYCKREFGAEHFTDLTNDQYAALDTEIANGNPILATAPTTAAPQTSAEPPAPSLAASQSAGAATLSPRDCTALLSYCEQTGVNISRVLLKLKVGSVEEIPANMYDRCVAFIDAAAKK